MTPYDDLKARAQKALDNDDWGTLKALFVSASSTGSSAGSQLGFSDSQAKPQDSGNNNPPPPPPPKPGF